jgi:tRNA pseudouridine55 synthase
MNDPLTHQTRPPRERQQQDNRPKKRDVHGWVVLDKPVGMTSTHAVAVIKRLFNAKKAGHAGTLDPLASGILPIALGEATKTVPYVMDGKKSYLFTVKWGVETETDDSEGEIVATSDELPTREAIEALLPRFTGPILQIPPRFSAIKIAGERAYDLARNGEEVVLEARPVIIDRISIVAHDEDRTIFLADCGKGTYVRAIARDMGRALGCLGYIAALRRTRVYPFLERNAIQMAALEDIANRDSEPHLNLDLQATIQPIASALTELEALSLTPDAAARLRRGQSVLLRGSDAPMEGQIAAFCGGELIAIGVIEEGEIVPYRVFHLHPPNAPPRGRGTPPRGKRPPSRQD